MKSGAFRFSPATRAERVDPERKVVVVSDLESGRLRETPYDQMLIATGARARNAAEHEAGHAGGVRSARPARRGPHSPPYPGACAPKRQWWWAPATSGWKWPKPWLPRACPVTVCGRSKRVMPTFEEEMSEIVAGELARQGVAVEYGAEADRVEETSDGRLDLILTDGGACAPRTWWSWGRASGRAAGWRKMPAWNWAPKKPSASIAASALPTRASGRPETAPRPGTCF